jgi:hypothetical protein
LRNENKKLQTKIDTLTTVKNETTNTIYNKFNNNNNFTNNNNIKIINNNYNNNFFFGNLSFIEEDINDSQFTDNFDFDEIIKDLELNGIFTYNYKTHVNKYSSVLFKLQEIVESLLIQFGNFNNGKIKILFSNLFNVLGFTDEEIYKILTKQKI